MSHHCRLRVLGMFICLFSSSTTYAEKLRITSKPAGATVELDGIPAGVTPFEKDLPGGYFHKTRTAVGSRLEHPMVARITLAGYATKEILLSQGPMTWIGLNGRHHGEYWLLKADTFDVDLDALDDVFTGSVTRISRHASTKMEDELSIEDLIARTKRAVVYLRGVDKAGTGFFVTQTGVIVTNAHVARNEESLALIMSGGIELDAKVTYVDDELDIALVKVAGNGFQFLPLADTSTVRQGDAVFAIGNPGDGMQFSVTRGIVSSVGPVPNAGRGTWIQTDAQINPGNSGGPLLNSQGEVIGISTQKVTKKNVSGISFALSAGDALSVLSKFYRDERVQLSTPPKTIEALKPSETKPGSTLPELELGTVMFSDPIHADIFVDGILTGQVPATLSLRVGIHHLVVKRDGCPVVDRYYSVIKGSSITIAPPAWNVPIPNDGCGATPPGVSQ